MPVEYSESQHALSNATYPVHLPGASSMAMPSSAYPSLPPPSSLMLQQSQQSQSQSARPMMEPMHPQQAAQTLPPPSMPTKQYMHHAMAEPMQQRTHMLMEAKKLMQHPALAEGAALDQNVLLSPCDDMPDVDGSLVGMPERLPMRRTKSRTSDDVTQGLSPEAKEALAERMRMENRERKKRWRERNEDRNKDNDLRCRVNKRANKLFGTDPSEHKSRWIAEEFERRRQKRKEKEARRKMGLTGLDTTGPNGSPLTSGQTTPVSGGLSYASHYHASAMQHAHRHPLMQPSSYSHLPNDLSLTSGNDSMPYATTGAQLDRKLPPPAGHVFFPANACACQGSVHEPGCRQDPAMCNGFTMPPPQPSQVHHHQPPPPPMHHHQPPHTHQPHHPTLPSLQQAAQRLSLSHSPSPINGQSMPSSATSVSSGPSSASLPQSPLPPAVSMSQPQSQPAMTQPQSHQRSDEDFPMDAVITLMQLNNGWRTLGGTGDAPAHAINTAEQGPIVGAAAAAAAAVAAAAATGNAPGVSWHASTVRPEPMTPSLSHSSTLSSVSSLSSASSVDAATKIGLMAPSM
ncbi:hypothetical protein THASP1DRAFT_22595 [Thamnocephalis sphaerospora]|uniref:DUF3020 domain-containing protein n=1 Tax=Thamnocephalis sphaerospora TaxID=78915 RepID=A0A4P9XVZ6_9FUNG|nr:hypothetical protein THASP1DRAFT_22595 [Thamnocephalis sphaerospora]|eukprot:RKP09580.1 hypothetical protein THASP1DRAFT_22595 [Thamnocephalis sphaerospora]